MIHATVVSIVIPCYNAARSIAICIESAMSQNGIVREILIVDDGSHDRTVEVASRVISNIPNARIICQRHAGVSAARNVGTILAAGQYLQYVDADDILEDGTLSKRVDALEQSGAAVACCDWQSCEEDSDGSLLPGTLSSHLLSDRPEVDLLTGAWWPPGAVMYKRDLVERIGSWNESLSISQDHQFLLLAASNDARFVRVAEVGLRYRVRAQSLSHANNAAFLVDCYQSARQIQVLWTRTGGIDDARKTALRGTYRYLARVFADDSVVGREIETSLKELNTLSSESERAEE